ncbi:leucine-rich repeat-containing protein 20 [Callorhinchus milii]|uniref:Leucine rich repeat containing 20 n=1 Tax=Callorhinchus milii TaxID=7868 RepID=V9LFD0_CALMI|nr:leucine-rich repeat-containing protein 20 [Callorhinchus milii]XP_007897339.1 leucine-rich repeat-containing protein 20 [Callorhinchus milii]XP_042192891.1 leucine-rich repeat-containing protein 20 [Callorhinchus milii]|eukprot:gi/632937106/ref/XP_007897338.1/ PREDICTED: leucine-rich repeat-containing protein 20 [Callorhinchus milii]
MAADAARVARIVNEAVEEGSSSLDLGNCKLNIFPVALFKVMRNIKENIHYISLANNEMKSVTSEFISNFKQLRELNLEGNSLKQLPDAVMSLMHLTAINLARNKFSVFPEQLTEVKTLENINLEENQIVEVPVEKIRSLPSLKILNLKSNPLSTEALAMCHSDSQHHILTVTDQKAQ